MSSAGERSKLSKGSCQGLAKGVRIGKEGVRIGKEGEDGCREKGEGPKVVWTYSCLAHLQPHQLTPQEQSSQAPSRYGSLECPRIQTCDTQGHLRKRHPHSLWVEMAKVKPKARPACLFLFLRAWPGAGARQRGFHSRGAPLHTETSPCPMLTFPLAPSSGSIPGAAAGTPGLIFCLPAPDLPWEPIKSYGRGRGPLLPQVPAKCKATLQRPLVCSSPLAGILGFQVHMAQARASFPQGTPPL